VSDKPLHITKPGDAPVPSVFSAADGLLLERVQSGAIMVCEFRGQTLEQIKWVDKTTGLPREMDKLSISVEFPQNGKHCALEYMFPKGVLAALLPHKKGDLVLVTVQNYTDARDGCKARASQIQAFKAA